MNKKRSFLVLIAINILLMTFSSSGWANSRLFSTIQQICTAYQVRLNIGDMNLVAQEDGSQELIISAESGRNDFDRIMLIAFYAAGKAMKYHQETISQVTIIVSMEYKGNASVVATSTTDDINKYIDGSWSSSDFVRKLKFS